MSRENDVKREEDLAKAREWLEDHGIESFSVLAMDIANLITAIRAETFEAAIEACGNASHAAFAIRALAKESTK